MRTDVGGKGQQTQRRLIEAARKVIARRGYHAARIDEIARVAKASRGTFYQYFESKEAIFEELLSRISTEMLDLADRLQTVHPDQRGYATLRSWLDDYLQLAAQWAPIIQAWTEVDSPVSSPGQIGETMLIDFTGRIGRRIRAGRPPELNTRLAAVAITAMMDRFSYHLLSHEIGVDRDVVIDSLALLILKMLHPAADLAVAIPSPVGDPSS